MDRGRGKVSSLLKGKVRGSPVCHGQPDGLGKWQAVWSGALSGAARLVRVGSGAARVVGNPTGVTGRGSLVGHGQPDW